MHFTILFAVVLACLRVFIGLTVVPEPFAWVSVFKDIAHLYMGGLLVAAWIKNKKWQWGLFWAMNALEVSVAVFSRM